MAITTWHILREDGTTVDITTKMQLSDALATVTDDESGHVESDLMPITEIRCLVCASKGGECSWHPFYNSECSCCATTPDYHGPDFWQA